MENIYDCIKILKESEKSIVSIVKNKETNILYIRKEIKGPKYIYKKLCGHNSPFIPQIYEVTYREGYTFILEQYIEGNTIDNANLSEKQIIKAFKELCIVLYFLHNQKIIHKDIKPQNIIIASDGHIRLIDFDISRTEKEYVSHDTRILGTPGFAPPEQYGFAQTDARTDIYQLGITLKQLLGPLAKDKKYEKIIKKCTSLDPEKRFSSTKNILLYMKFKKINRFIIKPIFIVILTFIISLISLFLFVYIFSIYDFQYKLNVNNIIYNTFNKETTAREYVFSDVIPYISEYSKSNEFYCPSDANFNDRRYTAQEAYEKINNSDYIYLYSNYTDENENYIFGAFTYSVDWESGNILYEKFIGIYLINANNLSITYIPIENCSEYPLSIKELYEKSIFDWNFISIF